GSVASDPSPPGTSAPDIVAKAQSGYYIFDQKTSWQITKRVVRIAQIFGRATGIGALFLICRPRHGETLIRKTGETTYGYRKTRQKETSRVFPPFYGIGADFLYCVTGPQLPPQCAWASTRSWRAACRFPQWPHHLL